MALFDSHADQSGVIFDDCLTAEAALTYHQQGLSVLPLKGKRPALSSWTEFQRASPRRSKSAVGPKRACSRTSASFAVKCRTTWL